ncbi:MAG: arsenic resistance N-acetyltransferase ArsN2 [Pseudomonadota bacterium]
MPAYTDLIELLRTAGLNTDDLDRSALPWFRGCYRGGDLAAAGGLEVLGDTALLRSLAVRADGRGRGLGRALLGELEVLARSRGIRDLYLLTETAAEFFARHGYAAASRDTAPARIRATRQFAELCPDSAVFMHKPLDERAD